MSLTDKPRQMLVNNAICLKRKLADMLEEANRDHDSMRAVLEEYIEFQRAADTLQGYIGPDGKYKP
jgi:hypothetical protein